ncbi:MAG: hypothetical protein JW944_00540 [Deltaproteobacteria bacterium]|nr:hypothetical protein [Deltaproteobacteria bacterium]
MEKLQKLIDVISGNSYHANYAIAKSTTTCIICGKPSRVFRDRSARLEYDISAMCQLCQDKYLRNNGD